MACLCSWIKQIQYLFTQCVVVNTSHWRTLQNMDIQQITISTSWNNQRDFCHRRQWQRLRQRKEFHQIDQESMPTNNIRSTILQQVQSFVALLEASWAVTVSFKFNFQNKVTLNMHLAASIQNDMLKTKHNDLYDRHNITRKHKYFNNKLLHRTPFSPRQSHNPGFFADMLKD